MWRASVFWPRHGLSARPNGLNLKIKDNGVRFGICFRKRLKIKKFTFGKD
jgi:hypothetical protein